MLKLHIFDGNTHDYYIDNVEKNIQQDEQLTAGLESTSNIWKVTLLHNYEHTLDIIQADDLQAVLYDESEDENHNTIITAFFTGYVTTSFNYTLDTHGQKAVQITLEDKATHLLKTPYTKDESEVLEGKFSSKTTGDLGVVQKICNACGITWASNIIETPSITVKAVASAAETCESLLKSLCKEMGYAYTTNANGQLYLIALSTDANISTTPVIQDISIYDSITLTRRARSYRGSRISWDELGTRSGAVIYRVDEGQSPTHPDCYVSITNGQTLPSPDGGYTYYDAVDLKNGSEIFSISNVSPSIETSPNNIVDYTTDPNTFTQYGANSLKILMTGTASGHITKLQATADITYVKSKNTTYGDGNLATESLHEETCRWIHDTTSATKYANFIAQYDRYCSNVFTFRTDNEYNLGDIIKLDENVYVGFWNFIMITKRTRTLIDYDDSTKTFDGVWSYEAVSTDRFNYTQQVTTDTQSAPPSTSYNQTLPDISDVSSLQLYTDKSFLRKDLRSTSTQTMTIKASVTAGLTPVLSDASYSDGTVIPINPGTSVIPRIYTVTDGWELICYENKDAETVSITGTAGNLTNTISISLNDETHYYKFLGNLADHPTDGQAGIGTILVGDFYVRYNLNHTTPDQYDGKTFECTSKTGVGQQAVLTWDEMLLTDAENANKFLVALNSATRNSVPLEDMSNPNTVAWFNTIIAAKAVISSLFSQYITILNGGAIHSNAYTDAGVYQGPGAGFWLGSNGELKCETADINNANAVDINISGNSSFHGSFDCSIIKTTPEDPSTYISLSPVGADGAQCKRIVDRLLNNGLIPDWAISAQTTGMIPISVVGVSDIAFMKVTYQKGTRSGTTTYYARVEFYNSSRTELNIRDYSVLNVSKSGSGNWTNHLYSNNLNSGDLTNIPGEYAAQTGSTDGITIRVLTGQDRLWMSLPTANEATALTSGMLFRSVNPVSTGTTGVTGYALYMKP